jgi:hypothetical protein
LTGKIQKTVKTIERLKKAETEYRYISTKLTLFYDALQRKFRLYIPFLGIARPQPQFPHSCVCERFIYSQDWSTYFLQQKRQTHRENIYRHRHRHRHMNGEIGTEAPIFLFWEYLFQIFGILFLQCVSSPFHISIGRNAGLR